VPVIGTGVQKGRKEKIRSEKLALERGWTNSAQENRIAFEGESF